MSCSCQTTQVLPTSPDGECLPTIDQACAAAKSATLCAQCATDADCLEADRSDGTTLANPWLDACCHNENVTLLGRVGNKLARFTQSGFIKLVNGKASVVSFVPLKVSTLWHRYWQPFTNSVPVIGDPLDFPYMTILDSSGVPHGIQGPPSSDAVLEWDSTAKNYKQTTYDAFVTKLAGDLDDVLLGSEDDVPDFSALFNTALTN